MRTRKEVDDDSKYIAAHSDTYEEEGARLQRLIVELLLDLRDLVALASSEIQEGQDA